MGFSRQEYWSELPFPSPGDLSNPGINLGLLHCRQILSTEPPGKANYTYIYIYVYLYIFQFSSVQFSRSVMSDSLRPHESIYKTLFIFWLCWAFVAARRLSVVTASGATQVAAHGFLIVVASLVAEHGL